MMEEKQIIKELSKIATHNLFTMGMTQFGDDDIKSEMSRLLVLHNFGITTLIPPRISIPKWVLV